MYTLYDVFVFCLASSVMSAGLTAIAVVALWQACDQRLAAAYATYIQRLRESKNDEGQVP